MTVLVTGGAGYIGSHMVLALCDGQQEVVVLDNMSTGVRANVDDRAAFVEGDIADKALVGRILEEYNVDVVVHFAGSIIVPESVADPLAYYSNNTAKTRDLLEACIKARIKNFIFSSTAAVYGIPQENPVFEDAPLIPISPYGTSKLITEWMLRDTAFAHDFRYVALRYFNVAGADPQGRSGQSTPKATHLIKVASEVATGQRPFMEIYGRDYETADGTCIRDYIHISDLIDAHVRALDYLREGGKSVQLNCGYGQGYSVLEVISAVERAHGQGFDVRDTDRRAGDPPALIAGAQKIKSVLGWQPKFADIDTIVAHAFKWEQKIAAERADMGKVVGL
jgi:UDP-glucose 4-epimerase